MYFDMSGIAIFMCLLGGSQYLWGPLLGGLIYAIGVGYFLENTAQPDVYIGIAFMALIVFIPGGLLSITGRIRSALDLRRGRAKEGSS
jgi:ABC-type branched-subunit amino acid transport system permease subunit